MNLFVKSLTLCIITLSLSTYADEAEKLYVAAKKLYDQRQDEAKNNEAIDKLDLALKTVSEDDLKFDILILKSKALYWKGTQLKSKAEKLETFLVGQKAANDAIEVGDYADGYYWSAANLGRWGETKGPVASLKKKQELITLLETVGDKDTKSGDFGEEYAGYGADRILGKMYMKLPPFAGGSLDKALAHLKVAYRNSKNYGLNVLYYSQALYSSGKEDKKALAKEILTEFIKKDPKTIYPSRVPETIQEHAEAKALAEKWGIH